MADWLTHILFNINCLIFYIMPLYEQLIAAALRFRATKLWERLDDSNIFAVALPDGQRAFCCVMGNAGEHFALGIYRGDRGFTTYLNTINASRLPQNEIFETFLTFDCINCEFVNANDPELGKPAKDLIKKVAADNGLKVSRPNGWPTFIRMNRGTICNGVLTDTEQIDTLLALQAATAVGTRIADITPIQAAVLGFSPIKSYVSQEGGDEIPLLTPDGRGGFNWSKTQTPAIMPTKYDELVYTDRDTAEKIKKSKHLGVYQSRLIHMPSPIGNKERSFFPPLLILVRKSDGFVLPVMGTSESDEDLPQIVADFGTQLAESGITPATIEVNDERTRAMLADLCAKAGIRLSIVKTMRTLDDVVAYFMMQMGH